MTGDLPSQSDPSAPSPRRWQFSLRVALLSIVVLSILFATASQFPRQSQFTVLMSVLMLVPLAVAAALRAPIVRLGIISGNGLYEETRAVQGSITKTLLLVPRLLGLCQRKTNLHLSLASRRR